MSERVLARAVSWLLAVAAAAAVPGALPPAPQITLGAPSAPQITLGGPSTARAGVEPITVDVSVLDKAGEPIRGLTADRFEVSVDGRPRRVVSAEFVDHVRAGGPAAAIRDSGPVYSTNAVPAGETPASGRLVVLVVDEGSFAPAAGQAAAEAARRFAARLQPLDRVGLVTIPMPGRRVAASTNHAAMRDGLSKVVGRAEPAAGPASKMTISLAEAVDIESGDPLALARASDRHCSGRSGGDLTACLEGVRAEARSMSVRAQAQAARTLDGLRAAARGLAGGQEPKTLVLVSAGLPPVDGLGGGPNTQAEVTAIAREMAGANATVVVLHVERTFQEAVAASAATRSGSAEDSFATLGTGLEALAAATGGTLARVGGTPDAVFDRVVRERASSYALAVEAVPADYDGRPHAIRVGVGQPGVVVRSRKEFVLAPRTEAAEVLTDPLSAALRQKGAATGLYVGVSTRTLGQAGSGGLRVLVTASVGRGLPAAAELRVGYRVTDVENQVVASHEEKKRLRVSPSNPDGSASYASVVALPPGSYTLRIAAIDEAGRTGSVRHPFAVGLASGAGITFGDLLLMEPARRPDDELMALADGRTQGREVGAYLEFHRDPGDAGPTSVVFAISERADGPPLVQVQGTIADPSAAAYSTAAGRLDLGLVPPGEYLVVATLSRGGEILVRRTQPLRIEAAVPGTEAGPAVSVLLPRVRFVLGPSSGLVGAFAREAVLTPDVLASFAGRLRAADPEPALPAVNEALSALRVGAFDAALAALREVPPERLSGQFLKGLALLGKGDLEPSAAQFRAALRIADDFLPAAFYLGACYAAGGLDREAAGAWQMALVTEDDARVVYDVLVDALLRQGEAERAAEIVAEARDRWKGDDAFLPRLAVAQAMLARPADALATLDTYLDRHPADTEAAALAVRLIYEARAAGKTVTSVPGDRALAEKHAGRYRAAGGANQALVDRWLAFILKN